MKIKAHKQIASLSVLLIMSLMLLQGCGFQLRGVTELSPVFDITYLRGAEDSAIHKQLKNSLQASGVTLASTFKGATAVITLTNLDEDRRALSERSGAVAEYELRSSATFAVQDGEGKTLMPEQTVNALRVISFNPDDVLGRGHEEQVTREDLRKNVVNQIMYRLSALK